MKVEERVEELERRLAQYHAQLETAIEQAGANKLIRPDVRYTGPGERGLPA